MAAVWGVESRGESRCEEASQRAFVGVRGRDDGGGGAEECSPWI